MGCTTAPSHEHGDAIRGDAHEAPATSPRGGRLRRAASAPRTALNRADRPIARGDAPSTGGGARKAPPLQPPWCGAAGSWTHSLKSFFAMPSGTSRYSANSIEYWPRPWVAPRRAEE